MRKYFKLTCCRAMGLKHSKVGTGNLVQNLETDKLTTISREVMIATELQFFMQNSKTTVVRDHPPNLVQSAHEQICQKTGNTCFSTKAYFRAVQLAASSNFGVLRC